MMGLQLRPDLVAALEARTEGWAAGLQLAALSTRGPPGSAEGAGESPGSWRRLRNPPGSTT